MHAAQALDGRRLAIKVQYLGVARSISSDVDNVATLLRISGLLPPAGLDVAPLLDEAKRQLHDEADYPKEAAHLQHYRGLLADHPDFTLPEVVAELGTANILVMSRVEGHALDDLQSAPQAERATGWRRCCSSCCSTRSSASGMCRPTPTSPTTSTTRPAAGWCCSTSAQRGASMQPVEAYRRLLVAGMARDRQASTPRPARSATLAPRSRTATASRCSTSSSWPAKPSATTAPYDFGRSDLARRMRRRHAARHRPRLLAHPAGGCALSAPQIGGLYLLAARLGARVDIRRLFLPHAAPQGRQPGLRARA